MAKPLIAIDELRMLLRPDFEQGRLYWISSPRRSVSAGSEAGTPLDGYVVVQILGRSYRAHRLIWALKHGRWPAGQIDHLNGVRSDNRIANLREVTTSENMQNRAEPRKGPHSSGLLGVSWHKGRQKWEAYICINGRRHHLGRFVEKEHAHHAYLSAKQRLHPASHRATALRQRSSTTRTS